MDREANVDHMPPSMLNTLSPGQSSPRLEASPLLFAIPPFTSSPMPSFLPHRISRPLTFYHHNRYIIPRSVFYSRVTHRGMRLFGILYASPSSPVLFFSPSSFFPPVIWSARSTFFSSFRCSAFFEIRLCCRDCWRSSHVVELDNVCVGILTSPLSIRAFDAQFS